MDAFGEKRTSAEIFYAIRPEQRAEAINLAAAKLADLLRTGGDHNGETYEEKGTIGVVLEGGTVAKVPYSFSIGIVEGE